MSGAVRLPAESCPDDRRCQLQLDENSANGTVVGSVTRQRPRQRRHAALCDHRRQHRRRLRDRRGHRPDHRRQQRALDFETTPTFTLTVAAIDNQGAYDTATVTIDLNNLDEAGSQRRAGEHASRPRRPSTGTACCCSRRRPAPAISISDFDAGSNPVQVTLTATNGTLNLPTTQGLTFTPPADGTADATMTFTGTVADINAALEGATFVATPGFTGTASVQITTDDLGNTGTGGP